MSNWKYSHPEGVLLGLTAHDFVRWPLERYNECLHIEGELEMCIAEAYGDLRAKFGPDLENFDPNSDPGDHKYSLRWHGLKILKEVQDAETDMG